ncbi:MAG: flagellar basal-body rod protein FlgG [Planctomycetes bacterium]|nr:flagellar basal-body rod protein FlgG [Planctomycetota bacterium]
MAILALHSAATGLSALSTQIDVISNNLANVNTAAFKSQRVNFEDLLYQDKAQPGTENANGDKRPAGIHIGLGVRISNTDTSFEQGSAIKTGNETDLMIDGGGFFAVDILQNEGDGIGYTRAGNFFVNSDGELVLGNSDGPRIEPPVTIPVEATKVDISSDGQVFATIPGTTEPQNVGQIQLSVFINPKGLRPIGGNIYVRTDAAGASGQANPGQDGAGKVVQGFLEGSNVDPVKELVELIKSQRAFEMNSQTIQAADQALQVVSNLRRA